MPTKKASILDKIRSSRLTRGAATPPSLSTSAFSTLSTSNQIYDLGRALTKIKDITSPNFNPPVKKAIQKTTTTTTTTRRRRRRSKSNISSLTTTTTTNSSNRKPKIKKRTLQDFLPEDIQNEQWIPAGGHVMNQIHIPPPPSSTLGIARIPAWRLPTFTKDLRALVLEIMDDAVGGGRRSRSRGIAGEEEQQEWRIEMECQDSTVEKLTDVFVVFAARRGVEVARRVERELQGKMVAGRELRVFFRGEKEIGWRGGGDEDDDDDEDGEESVIGDEDGDEDGDGDGTVERPLVLE